MVSKKNPIGYLNEIKDAFEKDLNNYNQFLDIMQDFERGRLSPDNLLGSIRELFKGHKTLISGFNAFLPAEKQIVLTEDELALSFICKVKTRFGDDHRSFESFLCVLEMYNTKKKKSIIEVYKEISDLFRNHHDLLLEFRDFLPDTSLGISKKRKIEDNATKQSRSHKDVVESSSVQADSPSNSDSCSDKGSQEFACVEKVKDTCDEDQLTTYMELYRLEVITRLELQTLVDGLVVNNSKLQRKFNKTLEESEKIGIEKSGNNLESSENPAENVIFGGENASPGKYIGKSIQDLDLQKCKRISINYRRLPKDFSVAISKDTKVVPEGVLNDGYVYVPSGSNGSSHRNKRKNPCEEKMNQLEDARFEIDMLIGTLTSTLEKALILFEAIKENICGTDPVLNLKDCNFTDQNLRCIENLYGDYGCEMLELLRKRAPCALPVILHRLIQKIVEWEEFRATFNRSHAGAHNHQESLQFPKGLCRKHLGLVSIPLINLEDVLPQAQASNWSSLLHPAHVEDCIYCQIVDDRR